MGWYPKAVRLPITTGEYWQRGSWKPLAVVDHITDGTDSRNWLQNVSNASSVHFLISRDGVVYQFMPTEWAAWANGTTAVSPATPDWLRRLIVDGGTNPNYVTISIEHEGRYPEDLPFTPAQLDASEELHVWIAQEHPSVPADRDHVIGHYQIDIVRRPFCPGGPDGNGYPFDRMVAAMQAARGAGAGGGTQPVDELQGIPYSVAMPYETTDAANLRTYPSTTRRVLRELPAGADIRVLGKRKGENLSGDDMWALVATETYDEIGYIHRSLLKRRAK